MSGFVGIIRTLDFTLRWGVKKFSSEASFDLPSIWKRSLWLLC